MHRLLTIVAVAAIALGAAPARAQRPALTGSHRSSGVVVTPTPGATAIQGVTLTALSAPLPNATVRLRDLRSGRVIDATTSDKDGTFTFVRVDPGSYVAELVGSDETVLAASPMLNLNADELISTVIKLPLRLSAAGFLKGGVPALVAVAAASAAAGVLASTTPGQPVSPVR
jgi:hypothetical protein